MQLSSFAQMGDVISETWRILIKVRHIVSLWVEWNGQISPPLLEDSKSKCDSLPERSADVLLAELCISAESSSEWWPALIDCQGLELLWTGGSFHPVERYQSVSSDPSLFPKLQMRENNAVPFWYSVASLCLVMPLSTLLCERQHISYLLSAWKWGSFFSTIYKAFSHVTSNFILSWQKRIRWGQTFPQQWLIKGTYFKSLFIFALNDRHEREMPLITYW